MVEAKLGTFCLKLIHQPLHNILVQQSTSEQHNIPMHSWDKTFKHLCQGRYEQEMIEPNAWDETFRQPLGQINEHEMADGVK